MSGRESNDSVSVATANPSWWRYQRIRRFHYHLIFVVVMSIAAARAIPEWLARREVLPGIGAVLVCAGLAINLLQAWRFRLDQQKVI
jgi:hypothetical protein